MNTTLQVVLVILSGFSTLFMGLVLFVLRDLRDRIVRLEDYAMGPTQRGVPVVGGGRMGPRWSGETRGS